MTFLHSETERLAIDVTTADVEKKVQDYHLNPDLAVDVEQHADEYHRFRKRHFRLAGLAGLAALAFVAARNFKSVQLPEAVSYGCVAVAIASAYRAGHDDCRMDEEAEKVSNIYHTVDCEIRRVLQERMTETKGEQ
jgi:hypothetical protein